MMLRLVRAEFLKLRSTQVWFWLLLASIAITVLGTVGQIAGSNGDLDLQSHVRDVFTSASSAYIALFVLGVLAVTTEYRYQTITPTVLATPSRWAIVSAKAITYLIAGVAYAVVCLAVEFAIAVPWLSARNITAPLGDQVGAIAAVFGVVTLMSLVGLGAGALMKNQIVAVSVGLVVLLVVENLVLVIPKVRHIWSYLPGGAINAMTTSSRSSDRRTHDIHLLPIWGGTVTLIVWALAMATMGAAITMRRDIT
jgi:ABC-2 type transport system permease protein